MLNNWFNSLIYSCTPVVGRRVVVVSYCILHTSFYILVSSLSILTFHFIHSLMHCGPGAFISYLYYYHTISLFYAYAVSYYKSLSVRPCANYTAILLSGILTLLRSTVYYLYLLPSISFSLIWFM